jgi:hypothetical protein
MTHTEVLTQWQSQDANVPRVSLEYLRFRVRELARDTQRRSIVRVIGLGLYGYAIVHMALLGKYWLAGFGFCLGAAGVAYNWKRRIRPLVEPSFQVGLDALTFYRAELERRRDACRKRQSWPAMLNFSMWMTAMVIVELIEFPNLSATMVAVQIAFMVIMLSVGLIENRGELNRLQRELDALTTL